MPLVVGWTHDREEKVMKKKLLSMVIAMAMVLSLTACGSAAQTSTDTSAQTEESAEAAESATEEAATEAAAEYVVGICNYVDDASLNQICDNIQNRLNEIGTEKGVKFTVNYDNCMADANVMEQIISDFIAEEVDLMVGVATPVAMAMQADTEDNQIPVIFAAVSDPLATGVVESLEAPLANVTGTSDFLDTTAVMNLIFAANPEADKIGLLYDLGQDASTTAIADAKAYLDAKGIEYVERTGTTVDEVSLAADALIAESVDAVFTPTDNTVMTAELGIYEKFIDAGIPHYAGADSFALNGAFCGYGVDYKNLGKETADMVVEILQGADPATTAVKTFDNGIATVNTETAEAIGLDYSGFAEVCTQVIETITAEEFE